MGAPTKYPLASLAVGGSVLVKDRYQLTHYISKRAADLGMRFKTKRQGEFRVVKRVA